MITRLQVQNFKSLRDLDLELGPLNVLVGPNMSGKSNILSAFKFLHQFMFPQAGLQGLGYAVAQHGGINELLWKGDEKGAYPGTISKLIRLAVEAGEEADSNSKFKYALEVISGAGDFYSHSESLKKLSPELFGRPREEHDLIVQRQGISSAKNVDGKELGGVGSSYASAFERPITGWDGNTFREWANGWRFYHLVPPAMKESGPTREGQILAEDGHNLSAWLMWVQAHSAEAFSRVSEVLQDLFPEIISLRAIPTTEDRAYLAARERGLTRDTRVFQMSDGFLVLTALLSLIYAPPELSGSLICLEEPENHLHPRLMETLVALLRQVQQEVRDSKRSPTQIILTTQSPYLVDQFSLDEVIWIEKKNGETKAFRPSSKTHLKKLVEDKELGLGDLMYSGALGDEK
jgi:predicted ATPase